MATQCRLIPDGLTQRRYIWSMTHRMFQRSTGIAVILFTASVICGCGSSDPASVTVIEVDGSPITRATLSHWMSVIAAGDNFEHVGRPAPRGLVSDPPDYRACKAAIESIGPPKEALAARLEEKRVELQCRQLYEGVKEQAVSFLIQTMWTAKEARRLGVEVSGREVEQSLAKTKAEYKTGKSFRAFLASNGRTMADERFLLRRNLQAQRLEAQRRRVLSKTIKDKAALGRALVTDYVKAIRMRSAHTKCSPDYVVQECSTYNRPPSVETPSPAVLVEQIAASRRAETRR